MSTRIAILVLGTLLAVNGLLVVEPPLLSAHWTRLATWCIAIAWMVCIYLWERADARRNHFVPSVFLNGAVILFSPFAVPYYLYKSRPADRRRKVLLRYVGLAFLLLALSIALTVAVETLRGI